MSGANPTAPAGRAFWRLGWLVVGFLVSFGLATSLVFIMLPVALVAGIALVYFDSSLRSTRPWVLGAIGFALGAAVIAVLVATN